MLGCGSFLKAGMLFFVFFGWFLLFFVVLWFLGFERFFSVWGFFDGVCEGVFGCLSVF
jgi:hypothetical protein